MATDDKHGAATNADALLALALSADPGPHDCPPLEEIVAWHERIGADADRMRIRSHIAGCDRCYELWLGLVETDDPTEAARSERPRHRERSIWAMLTGWLVPSGDRPPLAAVAAAAVAVLAGGLLFTVIQTGPPPDGPIPGYAIQLDGRSRYQRSIDGTGPPGAPALFDAGNQFRLLLQPAKAVDGQITVRMFLSDEDLSEPQALATPQPIVTDKGVIRIDGVVGQDVMLPAGDSILLVVVGRADRLPDGRQLRERLGNQGAAVTEHWNGWQILLRVQ